MTSDVRTSVLHDLRSRYAVIQACTDLLTDPDRPLQDHERQALAGLASSNMEKLSALVSALGT